MSDRLIKESDIIKTFDKLEKIAIKYKVFSYRDGLFDALEAIQDLPSADRPQGHWINGSCTDGTYYKRCNQCFAVIDETFFSYDFDVNFCPNCGARMKGAE